MSLYWPDARIAVDIIDEPQNRRFDLASHPDVTVFTVTRDQIENDLELDHFTRKLAIRLNGGEDDDACALTVSTLLRSELFRSPQRPRRTPSEKVGQAAGSVEAVGASETSG